VSFPFETDEKITVEETITIPREYEIDYETGQLTGKIVEGSEAIKVWIYVALKTPRYRYNIYSWDYGHELEDLIGKSYTHEYIAAEAKRLIEDCLSVNPYIINISNFIVNQIDDVTSILFTANTLFGEVDMIV
jgi:hypothetical protein